MIAKIICYALQGLEGVPVEVETDVCKGIPAYEMVGLPDTAVKESKERVRSALKNSGLLFPMNKITVNFAPADIKKEGAAFDLAVAVSLLKASEQLIGANVSDTVFLGELALSGELRPIPERPPAPASRPELSPRAPRLHEQTSRAGNALVEPSRAQAAII